MGGGGKKPGRKGFQPVFGESKRGETTKSALKLGSLRKRGDVEG